jgi:DME family drug/metabolite transporter
MQQAASGRASGHLLVLAAAVLWGTTGTAQAFAPLTASSATVGALRLLVGGVALLVWAAARGTLRGSARWPLVPLLFAAGSMAAYQVFFFKAVAATGVAVGTVVAIGSAPILAGGLGFFVRGERPGWRWAAATALAVVGCGLLVGTGKRAGGGSAMLTTGGADALTTGGAEVNPLGVLLALGAGVAYATYTVASKGLLEEQPPDAAMAVVFCLSALLLSPLLLTGSLEWALEPRGILVVLHLGLIATAVSYVLFARGLKATPVATAVTLSLVEPVTAALLGVVVLGERITWPIGVGIGLVFSGLVLLSVRKGDTEWKRESSSSPGKRSRLS